MPELISTRRIPGTGWVRVGLSLRGQMAHSWKPIWMYGCIWRWAPGIKGYGFYILIFLRGEGRCSVRRWDAKGRLVPCRKKSVVTREWVDQGCPDDPEDGPHYMTLEYCIQHAEENK